VGIGMNPMAAMNAMNAMSRIKMEDISDQANDVLARFRQQEERDEMERELKAATQSARTQRELVAAVQRHAAQMAAAAASAAGLPTAAHFAGLAASVVSSNVNAIPLNTVTSSANATNAAPTSTLISSSSPSGASGSSGPSSSPAIQSIEAGKGYTFEEQFKQVWPYLMRLTDIARHVRSQSF